MTDTRARLVEQMPFECRTVTFFAGGKQVQVVRKGDNLVMATFDYATEEGKAYRHCRLLNVIYNAGYRDCAKTTVGESPRGEWKRGWIHPDDNIPRIYDDNSGFGRVPIEYRVVGEGGAAKKDERLWGVRGRNSGDVILYTNEGRARAEANDYWELVRIPVSGPVEPVEGVG